MKSAPKDVELLLLHIKNLSSFIEETLPIYQFKCHVSADITPIKQQIEEERIICSVEIIRSVLRRHGDSL